MIPIYEQGAGNGIGHSQSSFMARFDEICKEHLEEGRAKAFAFIFYQFNDAPFNKILRDQGVFAKLDRLSGRDLSVSYLHTGSRHAVEAFNDFFLRELYINERVTLPCVVFFRVKNDKIDDVEIAQLDSADLIHGFDELFREIERYKQNQKPLKADARWLKWAKGGGKVIGLELFSAVVKEALERFAF